MESKLDQINEKLASIDKTLAVNTSELAHHIEQTKLLREEVKIQRAELTFVKQEQVKMKSIAAFVGIAITLITSLATFAYNIKKMILGL